MQTTTITSTDLTHTTDDFDALAEQVSRFVDRYPREDQITILISLQDALRDRPRLIQAAILAAWLDGEPTWRYAE